MSNSLSNGVSVTVSTDDLESKIDAVTGKFIKTLSKSQKALGMSIDEMGRFINANGKLVEGLSQAQIKLGQYVDEEGKLHTANGGLVADLNKIEQALGFYADELGNVYNAQKEKIRITAEARKKLDEERVASEKAAKAAADAAEKEAKARIEAERKIQAEEEKSRRLENELREERQRAVQTFGQAVGSFSQMSGQFASLLASIECTDDEMSAFRSTLIQTAEAASVFAGSFQSSLLFLNSIAQALPSLKTGLSSILQTAPAASAGLTGVGTAATTASVGMKAFQLACGPVGIAIAAIGAGLTAFATTGRKSVETNDKLSESFAEIERRAQAAGDKIRGLNDVLKYGAFADKESSLDAAQRKVDEAQASFDEAMDAPAGQSVEHYRQAGWSIDEIANYAKVGSSKSEIQSIDEATAQYKQVLDEYNNEVEALADQLRQEQQTEKEKLEALRGQYEKTLKNVKNAEVRDLIEKKITSINQKIADVDAKNLEEQQKKLEANRAALAKDLGISFDFTPVKTQADAMAEDLAKLSEAFEKNKDLFGGVDGALEEAENRIRQKYSDQSLASFSDALQNADSDEAVAALKKDLAAKFEQNLISQNAYDQATTDATKKLQELTEARIAAIPGLKEQLEANEAAKNAVDHQKEALKNVETYLHDDLLGTFSKEQFDFLNDNPELLDASMKEYVAALESAAEGLKQNAIGQETYNELVKNANKRLADATDDAAKKLRDDARSKLGIDAIMEELKTPAQKFADKMKEAQAALDANQINKEEFDAYRDKLQKEIYGERQELDNFAKKFDEPKKASDKPSKVETAKSMEAGSTDLYLAQVRSSTAQYQKQIQSTTAGMYDAQLDALDESRMTNYYLAELLENGMAQNFPVWG